MKRMFLFGGGVLLTVTLLTQLPAQTADPVFVPQLQPAPAQADNDGIEVLAYGQLHEAFAQPATTEPEPGPEVPQKPPDPVPEIPPQEKPEGNDVQWIPGYWSWDQEKQDFIWISGIYRKTPPGQQYVPGYWSFENGSWRWVAGFWAPAQNDDLTYSPPPPKSKDKGPGLPPEEDNAVYSPGYWYYQTDGWYWHPSQWVIVQPGLVWVPPHYRWTPAGCVLVGGYYDYEPEVRGMVFAPVVFTRPLWDNPGWSYCPTHVLSVGLIFDSCFVGPRHHHYYFGNYYGPRWNAWGYTPWFSFGVAWHDPIYNHYHYKHRHNPHWHNHMQSVYADRYAGKLAASPRIVNHQNFVVQNVNNNTTVVNNTNVKVKQSLKVVNLPGGKDSTKLPPMTVVSADQLDQQTKVGKQLKEAGKQRKDLESQFAKKQPPGSNAGQNSKPFSVPVGQMKIPNLPSAKLDKSGPAPKIFSTKPGAGIEPKGKPGIPPVIGTEPGTKPGKVKPPDVFVPGPKVTPLEPKVIPPKVTPPEPKVIPPKITPPEPKVTSPKGTPPEPKVFPPKPKQERPITVPPQAQPQPPAQTPLPKVTPQPKATPPITTPQPKATPPTVTPPAPKPVTPMPPPRVELPQPKPVTPPKVNNPTPAPKQTFTPPAPKQTVTPPPAPKQTVTPPPAPKYNPPPAPKTVAPPAPKYNPPPAPKTVAPPAPKYNPPPAPKTVAPPAPKYNPPPAPKYNPPAPKKSAPVVSQPPRPTPAPAIKGGGGKGKKK